MWRVVLTVSVLCWGSEGQIVCRDENGDEVDWYILYKVPNKTNTDLNGLKYVYINSTTSKWLDLINDREGVLANTLRPLLTHQNHTSDFGFISYNDQPPNKTASQDFGHSKGVVMMNKATGVWLLHSTPQFPNNTKQGIFWPTSGTRNAQIFICVTFNYSQFNKIGEHLLNIKAFPFDAYIPNNFHKVLQDVANKNKTKQRVIKPFLAQVLTSLDGQEFISFAKYSSKSYNVEDLYPLIAKNLNSNLTAQTWRGNAEDKESDFPEEGTGDCSEGTGNCMEEGRREDSLEEGRGDCSVGTGDCPDRWRVSTILEIKMMRNMDQEVSWSSGRDHSKWCVSVDQNRPWTCIADLNRAETQHKRPGGALCINMTGLWEKFTGFIKNQTEKKSECEILSHF
ncbi:deoxyribonuclease-2-beta-like [Anguilla anguilla]|uniref:deoxyribonuclease-2-beta-like n=1 Tax=Anguilla anguilla TaxID=7936 RepID=UPI0015A8C709|nr:deoxyribonuclease-2-beta-like [Anguilla anguilla]